MGAMPVLLLFGLIADQLRESYSRRSIVVNTNRRTIQALLSAPYVADEFSCFNARRQLNGKGLFSKCDAPSVRPTHKYRCAL
jgi:hypothetical protein